jgi:hypothetical protein
MKVKTKTNELRKLVKEYMNDMNQNQPLANIRRAGDFDTSAQLLFNYVQDNEISFIDFKAAISLLVHDNPVG